ncbi:YlqD family protein [Alkalihalobacillus pseudalcaliphilus]|uniref:YlqD family protein n=1 Tax=Alkalihalobacillus pseudalcaliphilus TaxID=79884 RepID=UPI00064DB566|nr:YlqD family protein [Alkalihalobacillus pseudalcaliphilus]KMK77355.1 hypothetical protein AB990_06460 [Alkalihalobacillus pseudalcaliphilus]
MKIIRKATVKHVLTASKKETLLANILEDEQSCKRELEQLEFQLHKALKDVNQKHDQAVVRKRYKKELDKRKERLHALHFKKQQLQKLEIGSEIRSGSIDTLIEFEVGDRWLDENEELEVIIKDGIIAEFRESRQDI